MALKQQEFDPHLIVDPIAVRRKGGRGNPQIADKRLLPRQRRRKHDMRPSLTRFDRLPEPGSLSLTQIQRKKRHVVH